MPRQLALRLGCKCHIVAQLGISSCSSTALLPHPHRDPDPPREYYCAVSGGVLRLLEVGAPLVEERVGGAAEVEVHGEAPPVRGQYPRQLEDD